MHTRAHISLIPAAVIACIACSSFGRSISCLSIESTRFFEIISPHFSPTPDHFMRKFPYSTPLAEANCTEVCIVTEVFPCTHAPTSP